MKNLTYILIVGIVVLSCNTLSKEKSALDSKTILEKKANSPTSSEIAPKLIMTSSGSLEQGKDTIIGGVNFTIVEKENGKITFWGTRDNKFKTPEGYSVGNQLKDISKLEKEKIYKEPGFGYFIKLNSSWQLGFCEGKSCTDNVPTENSIVKWIMKKE